MMPQIKALHRLSGKNLMYWERNQLVLRFTKIYPSWREKHPEEDIEWELEWRNIVFIEFPEGIFSWHIHDWEFEYFQHLEFRSGNSWDGSTTEQKYDTLRLFNSGQSDGEF